MDDIRSDGGRPLESLEESISDSNDVFDESFGFDELDRKEEIGEIFHALSRRERITVFHELSKGKRLTDIKGTVDVADSTVHNYANDLIDAGLIEEGNGYSCTWKGERVLAMIEGLEVALLIENLGDTLENMPISPDEELLDQILESEDLGLDKLEMLGVSREDIKHAMLNAAIEDQF